jgi:hypothetical protein
VLLQLQLRLALAVIPQLLRAVRLHLVRIVLLQAALMLVAQRARVLAETLIILVALALGAVMVVGALRLYSETAELVGHQQLMGVTARQVVEPEIQPQGFIYLAVMGF